VQVRRDDKTKYHGPGNVRGSRISARDEDGNRITISYPYELMTENAHTSAAVALCEKLGWSGTLARGSIGTGYVFVWIDERDTVTIAAHAARETK
jgi:hypothetical protein